MASKRRSMSNRFLVIAIIVLMVILFGLLAITSFAIRSENDYQTSIAVPNYSTGWPLHTAISGTATAHAKDFTPTPTPKKIATF